jgi:hypothetical protein
MTLDELLTRYEHDFLPLKAVATQKQQRTVFKTIRTDLGHLLLTEVTPLVLRHWRTALLQRYPTGTARRYLYLLSDRGDGASVHGKRDVDGIDNGHTGLGMLREALKGGGGDNTRLF